MEGFAVLWKDDKMATGEKRGVGKVKTLWLYDNIITEFLGGHSKQ